MIIEDENGREWTTEELRDWDREPTEPDPEPPLDLEELRKLIDQRNATFVDQQREAERRLLDDVLPELVDEIAYLRGRFAEQEKLHVRAEWAMTGNSDERPDHTTRWYHSPENAEASYGRPGQLWSRMLTIGEAGPISNEAPF